MFVLERILRGICEENLVIQSSYSEVLEQIREFKRLRVDSDYHEKLRLVVEPFLVKAVMRLDMEVPTNLRIILLANDFKIRSKMDEVDWIKVVKELIEAKELGLLVRLLRYLRAKSDLDDQIPLLLLNSINKLLLSNDQSVIGQVLQIIKLVDFNGIDGGLLRANLLKLLRGNMNDRIKWMILRVLRRDCEVDDDEGVIRMMDNANMSALIHSVLREEYNIKDSKHIPANSASKVVNLLNGHFDDFSAVESSVLKSDLSRVDRSNLSEYEKYILCECGVNIRDPNVLRELLRIDRISVQEYMKSTGNLDAELIVSKTKDPEIFWKFLERCDEFVTDEMHKIELRREFYDYYKSYLPDECSRLPVLWYLFKLVKEFEIEETEDLTKFREMGKGLYDKYGSNFDGSGSVFLLQ